jgi:hypothetical protein
MFKALFGRFRARRVLSPPPSVTIAPSPTASVEEIWSSWRYQAPAPQPVNATQPTSAKVTPPRSANAAERVNQLKRLGEYDKALRIALSEIEQDEAEGVRKVGRYPMVPWYYWEAAAMYRKLKRYDEEVALVRRFARNYDIHFRAFSKRYRSRSGANETWAARFLERLETAKTLAAGRPDGKS